ncbi:MAG: DUF881 domain-containing protein [Acidimicrobiia bacterium]
MTTVEGLARLGRRLTRSPWRPGRSAPLRRRVRGGPVLVVAATAVVGFLLVGQLGTTERFSQRLESESEENLARILASLTAEADALRDEISDLKLQLADLRTSSRQADSAERAADQQLQALAVLAGTVPVTGPGLVLGIEDPERSVTYDTLIDAVQELRDAGAEALAVNDRRVGVASAFSQRDGEVLLDGEVLSRPYRIAAIGQPTTLEGGLKIPGGVLDTLGALRGVRAEVSRAAGIDVPALARPPAFRAARPVGSAS